MECIFSILGMLRYLFHFRDLWVSWRDGIVRLGRGRVPYEMELFNYTDPWGIRLVGKIELLNYYADAIEWEFARNTGMIDSPIGNFKYFLV